MVLGSDGMLGHMIVNTLKTEGVEVHTVSRKDNQDPHHTELDVSNFENLENLIKSVRPSAIINCVGILIIEADSNPVNAKIINADLPNYLNKLTSIYGFFLVHASTDCVFSGRSGPYNELSEKDAEDTYGLTKSEGEVWGDNSLTIRTSIIGPDLNINGKGLLNWIMKERGLVTGYSNVLWGGVTTLEFSHFVIYALRNRITGLIHLTNGQSISKMDLLLLIKKSGDLKHISLVPSPSPVSDRSLVSERNDFLYKVPSYLEMIQELFRYIKNHSQKYMHYQ